MVRLNLEMKCMVCDGPLYCWLTATNSERQGVQNKVVGEKHGSEKVDVP